MKYKITALMVFNAMITWGQQPLTATDVISRTSSTLNQLKSISYNSYREINNFKDDYFSKNSGQCYFEYDASAVGKVGRFQLQSDNSLQVYNGTEYFALDHTNKTIALEKRNIKQMGSISLLYNSITTIRIVLPLLLKDQTIPKSLKDTLIEGKTYHLVKFALHKKTMEFPSGFDSFDSEVTKYYKLIIDKATALPFMIFDGNSISKDQYYTQTIFTHISTNPKAPTENSWYYSSYNNYIPPKQENRKPMIGVGSTLTQWSLPQYQPKTEGVIRSTDLKGKMVLMEFWIKNCGYCMLAFPEVKALQEKYGQKIEILSINAYEKQSEIDFFYQREKPKYKMLYSGEKLANDLGIYAYPATILLDQHGKVIYTSRGFDKHAVEQMIKNNL